MGIVALSSWQWGQLGLLIGIPVVGIVAGKIVQRLDGRWRRRNPGRSRTPDGDAPLAPYEPPSGLGYLRGLDDKGRPLPPPVKKRWRDILD